MEGLEDRLTPTSNSYVVTGLTDTAGTLTTAGHAGTAGDPYQDTTLRGAIAAATADGGTDTITFDPSLTAAGPATITLTTAGNGTAGPSDLDISTNITILGPTGTPHGLTLANGTAGQRLFYVDLSGSLTLDSLTLTGGSAGRRRVRRRRRGGGAGRGDLHTGHPDHHQQHPDRQHRHRR